MKQFLLTTFVIIVFCLSVTAQTKGFELVPDPGKKEVVVRYNGKLLTAYCYTDSIAKPFLYPVNTLNGITVTRQFPVKQVAGERTDHPHHIGIWMNYESVNGLDFWNNSSAIPKERKAHYGTIIHEKIVRETASKDQAVLETSAYWVTPSGEKIIREITRYTFAVSGDQFQITRSSRLTALKQPVVFKDVKDGFFAIRLAKELEMPEPPDHQTVESGMYYASNGLTGDSVWSSQGTWAMLKGKKDNSSITIALFDHPSNTGYPTYWHARGYGLFALNPLGRAVFSKGTDSLNLVLKPGESKTFTYRIVIAAADLPKTDIEKMAETFKSFQNN